MALSKVSGTLALVLFVAGCSSKSQPKTPDDDIAPGEDRLVVDTVKTRSDPKGGWFGPKLRDAYPQGRDKPEVYCGSGPDIPVGVRVTVFYRPVRSSPSSSACKQIIAVVEGDAHWADGEAVSEKDLKERRAAKEREIVAREAKQEILTYEFALSDGLEADSGSCPRTEARLHGYSEPVAACAVGVQFTEDSDSAPARVHRVRILVPEGEFDQFSQTMGGSGRITIRYYSARIQTPYGEAYELERYRRCPVTGGFERRCPLPPVRSYP